MGAYLTGVPFIGVYLMSVHLACVYLRRAPHCLYPTGVYVMGMHLIGHASHRRVHHGRASQDAAVLLSRTYIFAAFGGRWPGVAFLQMSQWPTATKHATSIAAVAYRDFLPTTYISQCPTSSNNVTFIPYSRSSTAPVHYRRGECPRTCAAFGIVLTRQNCEPRDG